MFCVFSSLICTWITGTVLLMLYILLGKPGKWLLDLNPTSFRLPLPNVNDKLYSRNKKLVHSEKINELKIKNPKSITFDRQGKLYTGSIDGCVYCLSDDECDVVASFPNGRPLGVRISNDVLYIIEANSGLYALNLKTKDIKHLLALNQTKFIDGKCSKFFDDLVIVETDDNTIVYITDVSRKFSVDMWCYTYLEPDTTGRILRYDVQNNIVTVLVDNLCFPNGIEVTENGDSLLICELTKRRILKYDLTSPNTGMISVFIGNLPGEPENIRKSLNKNQKTYWIGLAITRDYNEQLSFLDDYSTEPNLRKLILRSCYVLGSVLIFFGQLLNNQVIKTKGQHLQTGLALVLTDFMTNPGMAIEVDSDGNILQTIQIKNDISVISEIGEVHSNDGKRVLFTTSSGGNLGKIILN